MSDKKDLLKFLEEYEPICISKDPEKASRFASYEMAGYAFLVAAYKSLQCAKQFSHEGTDLIIHGAMKLIEDWFEGFTREDGSNEET